MRSLEGVNGDSNRLIYRVDRDAVVIVEVFSKTTQATPKQVIDLSQDRLRRYDEASKGRK